jgi:hypothetical protein
VDQADDARARWCMANRGGPSCAGKWRRRMATGGRTRPCLFLKKDCTAHRGRCHENDCTLDNIPCTSTTNNNVTGPATDLVFFLLADSRFLTYPDSCANPAEQGRIANEEAASRPSSIVALPLLSRVDRMIQDIMQKDGWLASATSSFPQCIRVYVIYHCLVQTSFRTFNQSSQVASRTSSVAR